jgi:uncharacterized protein YdeI (YjbR/CyaY-like superfamily)
VAEGANLEVPKDLADAPAKDRAAQEAFDGLSFTNREEYSQRVAGAKRAETRQRRLGKTIEMLRAGFQHP